MQNPRTLIVALLCLGAGWGCSHEEAADTSPLPPVDPKTRLEKATEKINASDMTPEQKQAALDYMRQGAANSQAMPKSEPHPKG